MTKQKILIVDDERFNLNVLVDLLQEDYKIVAAKDGREALQRATLDPRPDLILLDVIMPGIDGYEVCWRLKANEKTKDIPVIFITSRSEEVNEAKGLELGAIDYITKPLSPHIIKARIRNYLELVNAKVKAETATQAKANFLAAMSHEIRTPMNGVIGMVDLLSQSKLNTDQKQMLQTISDAGRSLLTIINDILDFSKIEAGKLDLESIPMSLSDVVETTAQSLATNAMRKGLRLITYIDPELPQFVLGDPTRIRQILMNLGSNAIKFTEKGEVVIRADQGIVSDGHKTSVRFSVHDQGIGISKETQKTLFQEFTQADISTTRQYGGTGLGLSICQRLTKMMGGNIGVNSMEGEGTEFYVTLEFEKENNQKGMSKVQDLKDLSVLLLVGNTLEQSILQRYLEHSQAKVTLSNDVDSCLESCTVAEVSGRPYDVIVIGPPWSKEEQSNIRKLIEKQLTRTNSKFISLLQGLHNPNRLDAPENIIVNVDPLRRANFLSAIAIAVGRASFEADYEEKSEDQNRGKIASLKRTKTANIRILVAEDNPTNCDVICRQLDHLGYTCDVTEDGKLALEAWHKKNYDILLTDCQMPHMDGFQLTKAIRQDETKTGKHLPIIAITANALQGEAERCLAKGMDDYIAKPININILRQTLAKWMPKITTDRTGTDMAATF